MTTDQHSTEAGAVADIVKAGIHGTKMSGVSPADIVVFPDKTIKSLELYAEFPRRIRSIVQLCEAKSFVQYLNAHKLADATAIFGSACEKGGHFTAIVDYHNSKDGSASWGEHVAVFNLVTTPEWDRWLASNQRLMTQEQFAEFLEDNLSDVVNPDAATLLEMAQLLTGKKGVTFKSGRNLRDGSIDFQYSEQIEATAGRRDDTMKLPDHFVIGLTPFVGANGVEVKARLRFRISDSGKLSFMYLLDRPFKIVEHAFQATRDQIQTETGLFVHMGQATVGRPQQ